MKLGRRALLAALVASKAQAQPESPLRDLARRAAICLTPPYEMYKRRHRDIVERGEKLNRLVRQLSPDANLLPAWAWLDLSGEPLFLSLPRMEGRFYSAVLLDPFARVFVQASRRTAGDVPPPYMIVGPAWKGDVSSEVTPIYAPAPSMWLRLRIAVTDDDEDVDVARGLQARTLLETPDQRNERRILEMRELMRFRTIAPLEPVADWPEPRPAERFDLFDSGLTMLAGCTLIESDRQQFDAFAPLRLRPGRRFDARAFSETEREAIAAGIADAETEIRDHGPRAAVTDMLHYAWIAKTALSAPTDAERP
jgi:hypothetical protein